MNENKKRIMFWGFVCFITILLSVGGVMFYYQGYGKVGQARKKLTPIAEKFNQVDTVIRNGGLEATVSGDKIVVYDSYNSDKYEYTYANENGKDVITSSYSSINLKVGEIVAKGMIDAVYRNNGGVGSVFTEYAYSVFTTTTIDHGVTIENGNAVIVKINLNQNIINNIKNLKTNIENSEVNTINTNDLIDLKTKLNQDKSYIKTKNTITLYIKENTNNYEIYGQDNSGSVTNELLDSFTSAIKILNTDVYNRIISNNDNLNANRIDDNYEVEVNYRFTEPNVFTTLDGITKVTIKKA